MLLTIALWTSFPPIRHNLQEILLEICSLNINIRSETKQVEIKENKERLEQRHKRLEQMTNWLETNSQNQGQKFEPKKSKDKDGEDPSS